MADLANAVTASSQEPGWADLPDATASAPPSRPQSPIGEPEDRRGENEFETMLLARLSEESSVSSAEADAPDPRHEVEAPSAPSDPATDSDELQAGTETVFETALLAGLSEEPAVSPDHARASEPSDLGMPPDLPLDRDLPQDAHGLASEFERENASVGPPLDAPAMDAGDLRPSDLSQVYRLEDAASRSVPEASRPEPGDFTPSDIHAAAADPLPGGFQEGSAAALAFAADPETEDALREGLLHFVGSSPGAEDPLVWPGGSRAAVAALADGYSTDLVVVDIDGCPYPAGAMHELAEVCEVGTAVIALGSDASARACREILLAGVSDYLVKPVSAAAIREAALRATGAEAESRARGRVAGFVGTGGSGATTLAAAMALHAAAEGRFVSVLDLNRTVSSTALLLDVDPAPGLDQLLEMAGKSPPDPKLLDGVRAERSERISVYAYRLGATLPPVPPMPALDWLLRQLRHRSQLVLVDGLDSPGTCLDLLGEVDIRVVVVEPTTAGAPRAARLLELMGRTAPMLLVQNHTRAFRIDTGSEILTDAGIETPADTVVPFDRSLPEIAGQGWPRDRLPRGLRKPVAALADALSRPAPDGLAALAAGA